MSAVEVRAVGRYRRVSPTKARRIIDLLRGRPYEEARGVLRNMGSPSAALILKVLESAGANAENNHEISPEECWVSRCFVDEAKPLQRLRFRARGRVDRIRRRYSHITICLQDEDDMEDDE
jgi:large subunit ribosomal protein L22